MESRLEVLEHLIREYLAMACTRSMLLVDFDSGEVESIAGGESVREAIEVAKASFFEFASTCEEVCGETPTNLYNEAEFVIGPTEVEAVITFRIPHPGESEFPVMSVKKGNAVESFTVESLTPS